MRFLNPESKEIRKQNGELKFRRNYIFESKWFNIFLHELYGEDEDKHLHNHPWRWFISYVFKGFYAESVIKNVLDVGMPDYKVRRRWATGSRTSYHKIRGVYKAKPVKTLVFAFGEHKPWGYAVNGKHVDSVEYRRLKNEGKI